MNAAIAAFRAGKPPHIVQIFEVGTATMMMSGAIYPVYKLFEDTGVPFDPDQFIPGVKGYYSFPDGRMAAMPWNSSTAVLWCNKDAFPKAGLDPNNPSQTWAEVRKAGAKIKAAGVAEIPLSYGTIYRGDGLTFNFWSVSNHAYPAKRGRKNAFLSNKPQSLSLPG